MVAMMIHQGYEGVNSFLLSPCPRDIIGLVGCTYDFWP